MRNSPTEQSVIFRLKLDDRWFTHPLKLAGNLWAKFAAVWTKFNKSSQTTSERAEKSFKQLSELSQRNKSVMIPPFIMDPRVAKVGVHLLHSYAQYMQLMDPALNRLTQRYKETTRESKGFDEILGDLDKKASDSIGLFGTFKNVLRSFGIDLEKFSMDSLETFALTVATATAGAFAWESGLRKVQIRMGLTSDEFELLQRQMLKSAATGKVFDLTMRKALVESLAETGSKTLVFNRQLVDLFSNLSNIEGLTPEWATQLLLLNRNVKLFGENAEEASRFLNMMVVASQKGAGTLPEITSKISDLVPILSQFNINLKDQPEAANKFIASMLAIDAVASRNGLPNLSKHLADLANSMFDASNRSALLESSLAGFDQQTMKTMMLQGRMPELIDQLGAALDRYVSATGDSIVLQATMSKQLQSWLLANRQDILDLVRLHRRHLMPVMEDTTAQLEKAAKRTDELNRITKDYSKTIEGTWSRIKTLSEGIFLIFGKPLADFLQNTLDPILDSFIDKVAQFNELAYKIGLPGAVAAHFWRKYYSPTDSEAPKPVPQHVGKYEVNVVPSTWKPPKEFPHVVVDSSGFSQALHPVHQTLKAIHSEMRQQPGKISHAIKSGSTAGIVQHVYTGGTR